MLEDYVFPEPWCDLRGRDVEAAAQRERLVAELAREVAEGHAMFGVTAEAVGQCQHCDDALFSVAGVGYAVVHLSYPEQGPDRPPWPSARIFGAWEAARSYVEDHAEFA